MSSLTCTVWACCRRLSRREKRLWQWHWNGRSPVCFLVEDYVRLCNSATWWKSIESYLMCLARCSLLVKLSLHGGYPLQKKRWLPFFFLLDRVPSAFTLPSPSESPQSSSPAVSLSDSSTSISSESFDFFDTEEVVRVCVFRGLASSVSMAPSGNGECGKGFCVAMPLLLWLPMLKLARVGVVASSIVGCEGAGMDWGAVLGRGVVDVITCTSLGDGMLALTDRKFAAMVYVRCSSSAAKRLKEVKGGSQEC